MRDDDDAVTINRTRREHVRRNPAVSSEPDEIVHLHSPDTARTSEENLIRKKSFRVEDLDGYRHSDCVNILFDIQESFFKLKAELGKP